MTAARSAAVALLSGLVLSIAFPEIDASFIAWIAISPLLIVVRDGSAPRGLLLGFVFGVAFFGTLLHWITLVGYVAWVVLVVVQSLFLGLFGALWAVGSRRGAGASRIVAAGVLWVAVEYLRSLFPVGGFTWGQLAQSQTTTWLLDAAQIGGAWTISLLVVIANGAVAEMWGRAAGGGTAGVRRRAPAAAAAVVVVLAPLVLPAPSATGTRVRTAIVQGGVPRSIPRGFERDVAILRSHLELTGEVAGEDVDLVVWPESAVALDPLQVADAENTLKLAAQVANAPIVAGGNIDVDEDHYQVAAFQVAPDGAIVDRYIKHHRVPFGEYVPARDLLDWIPVLDQVPRDALPGDAKTVFRVAGGRVATVISFEGDFGSLVRERIAAGGRLLIVATNTSTWGETWASAQHLAMSRVRAVESGVWVAHAAISGLSAFVAPDGEVFDRTELWDRDVIVRDLRFAEDITLYARTGDWLPIASLIVGAVLVARPVAVGRRRKRSSRRSRERE
jgi:apolipoprotein N-acyltransferase